MQPGTIFTTLKMQKNIHRRVLLLIKMQAATLLKGTLFHGCFNVLLNCTNGTKSRKASNI